MWYEKETTEFPVAYSCTVKGKRYISTLNKFKGRASSIEAQMCHEGLVLCYDSSPLFSMSAWSHTESPQKSAHSFKPSRKESFSSHSTSIQPSCLSSLNHLRSQLILKPVSVTWMDHAVLPMLGHNFTLGDFAHLHYMD